MKKISQRDFLQLKAENPRDWIYESFHLGVDPFRMLLAFEDHCHYAEFTRKKGEKILAEGSHEKD